MDAPYDCQMCDKRVEPDQPDPCFGTLPGVTYACCGHGLGVPNRAYITFENGTTVYWGGPVVAVTPECDALDENGVLCVRPYYAYRDH